MRPIFNEKVAEKWNLWVYEQCMMCTDWLKKIEKSKFVATVHWTVAADSQTHAKKKNKTQTSNVNAQSKPTLSVSKANESHQKGKTILLETSQRPIN